MDEYFIQGKTVSMSDFYGLGSTVGFIEIVEPETTSNDYIYYTFDTSDIHNIY